MKYRLSLPENFRGGLNDISAKKEALIASQHNTEYFWGSRAHVGGFVTILWKYFLGSRTF